VYDYHDTEIRAERLAAGRDHCDSPGAVYDVAGLIHDGRIVHPVDGGTLTTNDQRLIYAVSANLKVHVAFDGNRGSINAMKHETLFHNAPVEAAGEVQIQDGVVVGINDQSGSYGTTGLMGIDRRMGRAVLAAMLLAKVPMSVAVVDYLKAQGGEGE
jgi:hypothetical protein